MGVVLLGSIAATSGQGFAPPGNAFLMAAIMFHIHSPPGRVMGLDVSLRRVCRAGWREGRQRSPPRSAGQLDG